MASSRWLPLIDALAAHHSAAADALLDRLVSFTNVSGELPSAWLLAGARAALRFDPAAADRRLRRLAARPPGPASAEGRLLEQQLLITRATTIAALRVAVDSAARSNLSDDGPGARAIGDLLRMSRTLLARNDATAPGGLNGDLVKFGLAEFARNSLDAPGLGAWCFARLEQQWSASPYVAKALIARGPLEPDSSAALLMRLRGMTGNPYVAAANGDAMARVRVTQLEDSLGRFVDRMWSARPGRQ